LRCATRVNNKGRTKGKIITGVRKGIEEIEGDRKDRCKQNTEEKVENRRKNLEDNYDL